MSHEKVQQAVSAHVPCRHLEWAPEKPPVPFAVYLEDYEIPIVAGDVQIAKKTRWMVELYEIRRDRALEEALANSLREAFGSVGRDERKQDDDGLIQVVYTFYEIEGEFDG